MALILEKEAEHGRAEALYREVASGRTCKLGPHHPRTLSANLALANLLRSAAVGRHAEARLLYEEARAVYGTAVDTSSDRNGPEHGETIGAKMKLGLLLVNSLLGLEGVDDDAVPSAAAAPRPQSLSRL